MLRLAVIIRAFAPRPLKGEINRRPVLPRKSEAPAHTVVAARIREPEPHFGCADESAAERGQSIAQLDLQTVCNIRVIVVVIGGEARHRPPREQRIHAATR